MGCDGEQRCAYRLDRDNPIVCAARRAFMVRGKNEIPLARCLAGGISFIKSSTALPLACVVLKCILPGSAESFGYWNVPGRRR